MKLLNCWTKTLSVGLIAASGASQVQAQGLSVPGKPATFQPRVQTASFQANPDTVGSMQPTPMAMGAGYGDGTGGYPVADFNATCDSGGCDGACDSGCNECGPLLGGRLRFGQGCEGVGPTCEDFAQMGKGGPCCPHCGYTGCARCGWGLGLLTTNKLRGILGNLRPYSEGGLTEQRWFDLAAEATWFSRTKGAANFNFSSQGAGTNDFVLSSNNVDLDQLRAGLSLIGNIQFGVGRNVELVYFGLNEWHESATALSNPANSPTLFSFISDFGTDPVGGFDDPDRSFRHTIDYKSRINNGEVNLRSRWTGDYGWFQGSWLAGIRYFDLGETAVFSARGENNDTLAANGLRFFDYSSRVSNDLVGFQLGGDWWLNVIPGIKVGVEGKGAIMGNHAEVESVMNANSINNLRERTSDGRTAYLAQLGAMGVYKLSHSWAFRGSYQYIHIENVALATDNFNPTPPALLLGGSNRTLQVNNDGVVAYSGFTLGAEYTW